MLLASAIVNHPVLTFVGLVLLGIVAAMLGVWVRGWRGGDRDYDDLLTDMVVVPLLGLFALILAFTFSQALSLESDKHAATVSAKQASQRLLEMSVLLPEQPRARFVRLAGDYAATLFGAGILENNLEEIQGDLFEMELGIRQELRALASPTDTEQHFDFVLESLDAMVDAVMELRVVSARRIPVTVFGVQSLYYIVSFVIIGYTLETRGVYRDSRFLLAGLTFLFVVIMFIAVHLGRPGIHSMLFDQSP
jgi:hypothetical protein